MNTEYIVIPGTVEKVYDGTIVMLYRLPGTKWIIHCGYYEYNGRKQKGWYFSSIPSGTTMPVFKEDLVAMKIIDRPGPDPEPGPGPGPCPPGPKPPAPIPVIFTPEDKKMIERSMITVDTLEDRDKLSSEKLQNGKIVRVNDAYGHVEYYEWSSESSGWVEATLGYRYMTRDEITEEINDTVVDIVYSDSKGALVVTAKSGQKSEVPLRGLAHSPTYSSENLKLTIPVFGHEDLVVNIPKDKSIVSAVFVENYEFPDGSHKPAIVFTVSDGESSEDIPMDASRIYNVYGGKESDSVKVYIESESSKIVADVKLSSFVNNALKIKNDGLFVDISGKVDKKEIKKGFLLVADGDGEFTYAGDGISVGSTGHLEDYDDKYVVTANLITAAISAAIQASQETIQLELSKISKRVDAIEEMLPTPKDGGYIVVTNDRGMETSSSYIGGDILSDSESNAVAKETAVKDAMSWKGLNS